MFYKVIARAKNIWEEAVATYQLPEDISFTLRICSDSAMYKMRANKKLQDSPAGLASMDRETGKVTVFLNAKAIEEDEARVMDDVIPHEIAHIVCMIKPYLGFGHDDGWQEVCKRLGGTGAATLGDGDFTRLRRTTYFIYEVNGERFKLPRGDHNLIQGTEGTCDVIMGSGKQAKITKDNWTGNWI